MVLPRRQELGTHSTMVLTSMLMERKGRDEEEGTIAPQERESSVRTEPWVHDPRAQSDRLPEAGLQERMERTRDRVGRDVGQADPHLSEFSARTVRWVPGP